MAIRRSLTFAVLVIASNTAAQSQFNSRGPKFEVATIKPNKSDTGLMGGGCRGTDSPSGGALGKAPPPLGRCVFRHVTLKMLIQVAYGFYGPNADQLISGGPKWIGDDRFDLEAKATEPTTTTQMHAMLQALLAERFKLTLRQETRELGGFALVVAKNGPKLSPSPANAERKGLYRLGAGPLVAQGASVEQLAAALSGTLARPVLDKTELTGAYDFTLSWTPGDDEANPFANLPPELRDRLPPQAAPTGPSLYTAVQEQLGLKLEAQKIPATVFIIESAEKPADN